jgi:hypothetical protein
MSVFEEKLQRTCKPDQKKLQTVLFFPLTTLLPCIQIPESVYSVEDEANAKDYEPSGGCVSTYIAHHLQNTLIIFLLITPLSQYISKSQKCQVSIF